MTRWAALLVMLASCTSHPSAAPGTPAPSSTPAVSPSVSVSAKPFEDIAQCLGKSFSSLRVLARLKGSPDDLATSQSGDFWVTDEVNGTVRLVAGGRAIRTFTDPNGPEGIVEIDENTLVVAEQKTNRVVSMSATTGRTKVLAVLPPRGGQAGIDGLGFDDATRRVLIPDSPHGMLYDMPATGGKLRLLARGLGRDVGADIGADGFIYVASESAHGLWRVPRNGGRGVPFNSIAQADDTLMIAGVLLVSRLDRGQIVAVDIRTGTVRVVVRGVRAPQGLGAIFNGPPIVADTHSGIVASVCD